MARKQSITDDDVLQVMTSLWNAGTLSTTSRLLAEWLNSSTQTINRVIERLVSASKVEREGRGRATRLRLANPPTREVATTPIAGPPTPQPATAASASFAEQATALREVLRQPLGTRKPVTYRRDFVDDYVPNSTFLLPSGLADELANLGRMKDQQPAGTYARKVLEPLLIDLSWSSSHLEGNNYTRLDTEELFKSGIAGEDLDAVMLLNHKNAIEFLVDAVPEQGLNGNVIRNLHALLMRDLLPDSDQLGAIRQRVVNISDTVYLPSQVPLLLEEMLGHIIAKACLIKNPVEAAFFLWVNLAYLQPFEDGNKRVSRVSSNIPLMLYNCAPLSFMDVDRQAYAEAMLGVYEKRDVTLAIKLFDVTYRRSTEKYAVILEAMGKPDPTRLRYRESLNDAICLVVRERKSRADALQELQLTADKAPGFEELLTNELQKLEEFNCARYRLTMNATKDWIAAGRPS